MIRPTELNFNRPLVVSIGRFLFGGEIKMGQEEVVVLGFQRPQPAKENWVAGLYEKYGLGQAPSLEEIEPKATELLASGRTALSGADKFGLLLMQKQKEITRAEQAAKQKTG